MRGSEVVNERLLSIFSLLRFCFSIRAADRPAACDLTSKPSYVCVRIANARGKDGVSLD